MDCRFEGNWVYCFAFFVFFFPMVQLTHFVAKLIWFAEDILKIMFNVVLMCNVCVIFILSESFFFFFLTSWMLRNKTLKNISGFFWEVGGGVLWAFRKKAISACVGRCCCVISYVKMSRITFKNGHCRNRGKSTLPRGSNCSWVFWFLFQIDALVLFICSSANFI